MITTLGKEVKVSVGRLGAWMLILMLLSVCVQACSQTETVSPESSPSSTNETLETLPSSTPTRVISPSFVAVEPTDAPQIEVLPLVTPSPTVQATPFPDEQEIVHVVQHAVDHAVVNQASESGHWVAHPIDGAFTASGAPEREARERLALVGNIGDENEIRWVIVERVDGEDDGRLIGVSEWLGAGFDAPPPFYLPPSVTDFDRDGRQEIINHYYRMRGGLETGADTIYRWDGQQLARIWQITRIIDNLQADSAFVTQPYRQAYRADWNWLGNSIIVSETVRFYPEAVQSSLESETNPNLLGEESWRRQFCWDQTALRPCAPTGPAGVFAYTVLGDLWLWQNHRAHPLGDARNVIDFQWSLDGEHLAWASRPGADDDARNANHDGDDGNEDNLPATVLGVYELETGETRRFQTRGTLERLFWLPDGRLALAYTQLGVSVDTDDAGKSVTSSEQMEDYSVVFLDPESGQISTVSGSGVPAGAFSPDGQRVIYEEESALYIYDLKQEETRLLVSGLEHISPVWSPRGDWIAYHLSYGGLSWPAIVSPNERDPLAASDLLTDFDERAGAQLRLAWSIDGAQLAVLVYNPRLPDEPANLYIAQSPPDSGGYAANLDWELVWQTEGVTQLGELLWSWAGDRIALTFNREVWDISTAGESKGRATKRREFSIPHMTWSTLAWAPDDSGFIVSLAWDDNERLFWIPKKDDDADSARDDIETEDDAGGDNNYIVPLLADSTGSVRWSSQIVESERELEMVFIDYTSEDPVFHFTRGGETDIIISAKGDVSSDSSFQISGDRIYYNYRYAHRLGGASLVVPDRGGDCHSPVVSADGQKLAWICDGSPPNWSALVDHTAEIPFHLIITDDEGKNEREVWTHVEAGPDYRSFRPMGWRDDGEVIYLSQPKYGAAQTHLDYNPGVMAFNLNSGEMEQIGDLEGAYDARVSSDGAWLIQSKTETRSEGERVQIQLRSLVNDFERPIASAEGATIAGDFSFSPREKWVAWREWVQTTGGSILLVRAMRLPDGEAITICGDIEDAAPKIGGWLREGELVMVYPVRPDGTGGQSASIVLPNVGQGAVFSPHSFIGVLGRD